MRTRRTCRRLLVKDRARTDKMLPIYALCSVFPHAGRVDSFEWVSLQHQ